MFGYLSFKRYVLFGIGAGFFFYLFGLVAGNIVAAQFEEIRRLVVGTGIPPALGQIVLDPVIWVFSGDIFAAVMGGILWPLVLFWLILVVALLALGIIATGLGIAGQQLQF